jgi:capsular exopolysaccharide synthesis family protein
MSRIFDALQRANLKAGAPQEADYPELVDPIAASDHVQQPPIQRDGLLEMITLNPWKPALDSLPTLGERGEGIEQFRSLRTQIYQFRDQAPLKSILVSSGMPAEGKSFVAANLAISLARNRNHSVLLIDADMRKSSLHKLIGAPSRPGLAEFLGGTAQISEIMQRNQHARIHIKDRPWQFPELTFIPAGEGGDHSSELVANHRFEELISTLSPYFDWIVIDSPPILPVADSLDLARVADSVLLVARSARTPYNVVQRAQAAFSKFRILGFVLNASMKAPHSGAYYYYGKKETGGGSNEGKG